MIVQHAVDAVSCEGLRFTLSNLTKFANINSMSYYKFDSEQAKQYEIS